MIFLWHIVPVLTIDGVERNEEGMKNHRRWTVVGEGGERIRRSDSKERSVAGSEGCSAAHSHGEW